MEITSVEIHKIDKEDSRMRAFANVTIDDCFIIHGIKVVETPTKTLVVMPSRTRTDGTKAEHVHPITKECRQMFEDAVLGAYNKAE